MTDFNPAERLSYSALTKHRQCPQAWTYRYLRGLEQDSNALRVEADFGSWWHALRAAEAIERGLTLSTLRFAPPEITTSTSGPVFHRCGSFENETFNGRYSVNGEPGAPITTSLVIDAAIGEWQSFSPEVREIWLSKLGGTLPDRLAYVDKTWRERYADDLANEAPIAVELKFSKALPGTSAALTGYLDLVYLDFKRNLVVVRDLKTSKKLDAAESADDLMDSQLHLYAWGANDLVKGWMDGRGIGAVSYDRARSIAPKAPQITVSGTLSKSVTDYDLHTYLAWLTENASDGGVAWGEPETYYVSGAKAGKAKFGVYRAEDSVIARLTAPAQEAVWFQRTLVPLNMNVVRAHVRAVIDTAEDAQRTVERFARTGEAARNLSRKGCAWCFARELCRAELMGGIGGDYPLADFGLKERDQK